MCNNKRRYQVNYKVKLSNTVRRILILLSIVMIALGSGNILAAFEKKNEKVSESGSLYKYTNKFNSSSKINLKDNKYFTEEEMAKDQAYLSDLISSIDMQFKYEYVPSKQTEIIYDYKIEAVVNALYNSSNASYNVLNKSEILKQSNNNKIDSSNIKIEDKVNVDYSKYHQMVKEFKQAMGINIDSYLYIKLVVNTKTTVEGKEVENEYTSNYKISLGDKVAIVEEKNSDEISKSVEGNVLTHEVVKINYKDIVIGCIVVVFGFILLFVVLRRTEEMRIIKNEFKLELNKILKSYEDKIVEIQDIKNINIKAATKVKDIIQLRKLAEEALVPIYCYIKDEGDSQEAYFIVTKYEQNYIYILK